MKGIKVTRAVSLRAERPGTAPKLVWRTLGNDLPVEYTREPSNSLRRRVEVNVIALLPMEREL